VQYFTVLTCRHPTEAQEPQGKIERKKEITKKENKLKILKDDKIKIKSKDNLRGKC
jgi:hypothetical protein